MIPWPSVIVIRPIGAWLCSRSLHQRACRVLTARAPRSQVTDSPRARGRDATILVSERIDALTPRAPVGVTSSDMDILLLGD